VGPVTRYRLGRDVFTERVPPPFGRVARPSREFAINGVYLSFVPVFITLGVISPRSSQVASVRIDTILEVVFVHVSIVWSLHLFLIKNINATSPSAYGCDAAVARAVLYRFEQGVATHPREGALEEEAYTLLETASGKVERRRNEKEVKVDATISQGVPRSQVQ